MHNYTQRPCTHNIKKQHRRRIITKKNKPNITMNYFDSLLLFNVLKAKPPVNDTQILINEQKKNNEYYYYFLLFLFGIFLFASKINELYFLCGKNGLEHKHTYTHTHKI